MSGDGEIAHPVHLTQKEAVAMGIIKPASFTQEEARATTPRKRRRGAVKIARAEKGTARLRLAEAEIHRKAAAEKTQARIKAEEIKTARLKERERIKAQNRARQEAYHKKAKTKRKVRNIGLATKRAQRTAFGFAGNTLRHLAATPAERRAAIRQRTRL